MPWKPNKPCRYPGCANLVQSGEGYCDTHKKRRHSEYNAHKRDELSKSFYGGRQWRRVSKMQLQREPFCADCMPVGFYILAEVADHIIPIRNGGARYDFDNLQSLCKACHNRKTFNENRGMGGENP